MIELSSGISIEQIVAELKELQQELAEVRSENARMRDNQAALRTENARLAEALSETRSGWEDTHRVDGAGQTPSSLTGANHAAVASRRGVLRTAMGAAATMGVGAILEARGTPAVAAASAHASGANRTAGQAQVSQVTLVDPATAQPYAIHLDAQGNAQTTLGTRLDSTNDTVSVGLHNGTTYDPMVNNRDLIALTNGARSTTTNGPDIVNYNARGGLFVFVVTYAPKTGDTVTLQVYGRDILAGYYLLYSASPLSEATDQKILLYPGATGDGTGLKLTDVSSTALPRLFHVRILHSGSGEFRYQVGLSLLGV